MNCTVSPFASFDGSGGVGVFLAHHTVQHLVYFGLMLWTGEIQLLKRALRVGLRAVVVRFKAI